MDDLTVVRQRHSARCLLDTRHVVRRHHPVAADWHGAAAGLGIDVATGDADIGATDRTVGGMLGLFNRLADGRGGGCHVGHNPFGHAIGWRAAETDDMEGVLVDDFSDNCGDFGGANIDGTKYIGHVSRS